MAKALALIPDIQNQPELLNKPFLSQLEQNLPYWELGHDLHDMKLAVRHATAIVRSVRLLGEATPDGKKG